MESTKGEKPIRPLLSIPWFGARKVARALFTELQGVRAQRDEARKQLETLGVLSIAQLEDRRAELERQIAEQSERLAREKSESEVSARERQSIVHRAGEPTLRPQWAGPFSCFTRSPRRRGRLGSE